MIVGKLKDLHRYRGLNLNLDKAINYIIENDLTTLNLGQNDVDGENVFINRFNYICQNENECLLEGHKKYLDLHIVLKGSEMFGYNDISELSQITEYEEKSDFIKFEGLLKTYIKVTPGDFIITFPEDIHMPKITVNDDLVEKAVFKILL